MQPGREATGDREQDATRTAGERGRQHGPTAGAEALQRHARVHALTATPVAS